MASNNLSLKGKKMFTHIASKDRTCDCCGAKIKQGDRMRVTRKRARSNWHALNAGSMYPKYRECETCAIKQPPFFLS